MESNGRDAGFGNAGITVAMPEQYNIIKKVIKNQFQIL